MNEQDFTDRVAIMTGGGSRSSRRTRASNITGAYYVTDGGYTAR